MPKATKQKDAREEKVLEKDETERKLESVLFGDSDEFQNALRTEHDPNSSALTAVPDESADEAAENHEEQDLEDLADEDVGLGII